MTVRIVKPLEVINVHGQYRHTVGGPAAAGYQRAVLVEVAAVGQLGERVGARFRLGRLVRVDPGQRRGCLEGRGVQESDNGPRPDVAGATGQDDGTRDGAPSLQRRRQSVAEAYGLSNT